jgi:acetate kinase
VTEAILALNAGSSSLKFGLYPIDANRDGPTELLGGSMTGLGGAAPTFTARAPDGSLVAQEDWVGLGPDAVTARLIDWVEAHLGPARLAAVGHRIVHGGRDFFEPVAIDDHVLARLDALTPLAPLHQPLGLAPVRRLRALRPALLQIACFDTAFHHDLAPPVSRYGVPRALEAEGIRRYGFHGLSYESIAAQLAAQEDGAGDARIVVAHLGNGASLCALQGLRSVDTTMGFTALDGLVMGTRPGPLDPGILLYLQREKGYSLDRVEHLLYHESGLLGVSGVSADVATLLQAGSPAAAEALDLFAFQVARQTAALAATMGGIDRFVFTGGIGEHAPTVRAMIARRLEWMGAVLDDAANLAGRAPLLSAAESRLRLQVLPAREEHVIAAHVVALLPRPARGA